MKMLTVVKSLLFSQGQSVTDTLTDRTTAALLYPLRNTLSGDNYNINVQP